MSIVTKIFTIVMLGMTVLTIMASFNGWGLERPKKVPRGQHDVRTGSTHAGRRGHLYAHGK